MNDLLTAALHKLIAEGLITEAEGLHMNLATTSRSREHFEKAIEATGNLLEIVEFETLALSMKVSNLYLSKFMRGFTDVRIRNAILKSRPEVDPTPIVDYFYRSIEESAAEEQVLAGEYQYCVLRRLDNS
mmetsp:Transcript_1947/g.4334  ORF Transcript_1947/g.4334 Transcript_1947/m.4334 type:complete len:130 (-) Transcript_1947:36-425(-)